jgi:hypothetical protein
MPDTKHRRICDRTRRDLIQGKQNRKFFGGGPFLVRLLRVDDDPPDLDDDPLDLSDLSDPSAPLLRSLRSRRSRLSLRLSPSLDR